MSTVTVYLNERLVYFEENGDILYDIDSQIALKGWRERWAKYATAPTLLYTHEEYLKAEEALFDPVSS